MRTLRHIEGFVQVVENRNRYFLRGPRGFIQGADFAVFSSTEEARSCPGTNLVGLGRVSIEMAESEDDVVVLRQRPPWILIQAQHGSPGECVYELYGDRAPDQPSVASPGRCQWLGANGEWRQFQEWAIADYAASELCRQGACPVYPAHFSLSTV